MSITIGPGREDLGTSDPYEAILKLAAERDDLRALAADIIGYLERMDLLPKADDDLIPEWRERAGLGQP